MDTLFKTFLKYRYVLAGAVSGLVIPTIKLFVDYVSFNPLNLGIIKLLSFQLKMPQQKADYLLLTMGPVIMMTLAGAVYGKIMQVKDIAFKDPLTGAFNKRYLQETEKRLKRKDSTFTLAMIDLDNFKPINDKFGHHAGDEALKSVYKAFEEEKRVQDIVIRYGGDEFVMILPVTDLNGAKKVLERVRSKVEAIQYGNIKLGFSLGMVTEHKSEQAELHELIKKADKKMYVDKRAKKHKR